MGTNLSHGSPKLLLERGQARRPTGPTGSESVLTVAGSALVNRVELSSGSPREQRQKSGIKGKRHLNRRLGRTSPALGPPIKRITPYMEKAVLRI